MLKEVPQTPSLESDQSARFKNYEEALAELRKPEARASLETYVPVSFEAFRNCRGNYGELIAETAHALLEIQVRQIGLGQRETEFLHELIDLISKQPSDREPERCKDHEEQKYQLAKKYVFKHFDVAMAVVSRVESFYEFAEEIRKDGDEIKRYCDPTFLDHVLSWQAQPIKDKMKGKVKELPKIPLIGLDTSEYIRELRKYITEKIGQDLRFGDPDTALMCNLFLPYNRLGVGTFDSSPLERIYVEAVQEIPGLKDKIVEIGRKYGVEMKID